MRAIVWLANVQLLVGCVSRPANVAVAEHDPFLSAEGAKVQVHRRSPTKRATPLGEVEGVAYSEHEAISQMRSEAATRGANFLRVDERRVHCVPKGRSRGGGASTDCGYLKVMGFAFFVVDGDDPPIPVTQVRFTVHDGDQVTMDAHRNVVELRREDSILAVGPFTASEDPRLDPIITRALNEDLPSENYEEGRSKLWLVEDDCRKRGCTATTAARLHVALGIVGVLLGTDVSSDFERALRADPKASLPKRWVTREIKIAWDTAVLIVQGARTVRFMPGSARWKDNVVEGQLAVP
jgi:hypothetical protein